LPGVDDAFFGLRAATFLVLDGTDAPLPPSKDDDGKEHQQQTLMGVLGSMFRQICLDYPGLPDPRSLTANEIRFFYDGLRAGLRERTKPKQRGQTATPTFRRYR
jgi:hypothetical protein